MNERAAGPPRPIPTRTPGPPALIATRTPGPPHPHRHANAECAPTRGAPGVRAYREYLMSARTMWQVVSDGGWTPIVSAAVLIVSLRAWFGM